MEQPSQRLIPPELLTKADKILFIAHCALGDFTYLYPFFKAFSKTYPHIKIHFWSDEVRRTYFFWRWKYIKDYILYDWLYACPFFEKLYTSTYTWPLFKKSIQEARTEEYPIIVSLCTLRSQMYAHYARQISPCGYIVGIESKRGNRSYDLDAELPYTFPNQKPFEWHVTDMYNLHFKLLFGIDLEHQARFPIVEVPSPWKDYGKKQFVRWGVLPTHPVIFINPFAKDKKRCWEIKNLIPLLHELSTQKKYTNASFIINAPPEYYDSLKKIFYPDWRGRVFLFLGSDNFFQTPSVLKKCDLIISVETSIMHLAIALKKPLVALMRLKSPEWIPLGHPLEFIVFTKNRNDWISSISIDRVSGAVMRLRHALELSH